MPEIDPVNVTAEQQRIVDRYRKVVGALDVFFRAADERTVVNSWRLDGVGGCGVLKETADGDISGPAASYLFELREQRNVETGGEQLSAVCPYHRKNFGCVLGDLKSPTCISHIDSNAREIKVDFGIHTGQLRQYILRTLGVILSGQEEVGVSEDGSVKMSADEYVDAALRYIYNY